jgi:hypothetical protein
MITVYTAHTTPRLSYILDELLQRRLGVSYVITTDAQAFAQATSIKINYSTQTLDAHIQVIPHGLLDAQTIHPIAVSVNNHKEWHLTFWEQHNSSVPFDVFAAAFYLLSRYEEYTSTERDVHGRFEAKNSLAWKHDFLTAPLIELWCEQLKNVLTAIDVTSSFTRHTFTQQVTIDVDLAYAYYGITWWKWLGKMGKHALQADISGLKTAFVARFNPKHDPFNTYTFINEATHNQAGYFMLMNNEGGYDRGISPAGDAMKKLVSDLTQASAFVGIHPSYASTQNPKQLQEEVTLLSQLTSQHVTKSRQHFLKLSVPETYSKLAAVGIKEDYTLFYAEAPGFRASTCFPFHFYNLQLEEKTDLLVMPTCLMDTTLSQYLQLPPNLWYNTISSLKQTVTRYRGVYITLWHNNTFAQSEARTAFLNLLEP